jgi:MFS superfamily sulfate permease-like transporter
VSTILGVLATDLLVGIGIGILVKAVIHVLNGAPIGSLFKSNLEIVDGESGTATIAVNRSAVFATWISLKHCIERQTAKKVVVDLSGTKFVDHTVRASLDVLKREFEESDRELSVVGTDGHRPLSSHPLAALKASG